MTEFILIASIFVNGYHTHTETIPHLRSHQACLDAGEIADKAITQSWLSKPQDHIRVEWTCVQDADS
jgi:hypothetical protein